LFALWREVVDDVSDDAGGAGGRQRESILNHAEF